MFKGTVSRDFLPSVFSSNNPPQGPDSWAKAVSNMASNSPRKSKIIVGNVWLPRSHRDSGILKKISTTFFIHGKVVFCTKLRLKKFGFRGLIETAEAALKGV
jgi:hypothetical protein